MEIYILVLVSVFWTCCAHANDGNVARPATDESDKEAGCCGTQRGQPLDARRKKESPQSCTKGTEKGNSGCSSKDSHNKYSILKNNNKQNVKERDENQRIYSNELILIKGGSFVIGTDKPFIPQDAEAPARKVILGNFYIHKFEVSNNEFSTFIKETRHLTEVDIKFLSLFLFKFLSYQIF